MGCVDVEFESLGPEEFPIGREGEEESEREDEDPPFPSLGEKDLDVSNWFLPQLKGPVRSESFPGCGFFSL